MSVSSIADTIDLREAVQSDYRWAHLRQESIRYVGGIGQSPTNVMIVGEAPGASENTAQKPFVGKSGRVLRSLMSLAGLYAEKAMGTPVDLEAGEPEVLHEPNCWLTNVVKYRPPGNRTPTTEEILVGRAWLREEWRVVGRPRVLVAVGAVANAALSPSPGAITRVAGTPITLSPQRTLWPMLHPAYGLRNPLARPEMEADWERLGEWLREEELL